MPPKDSDPTRTTANDSERVDIRRGPTRRTQEFARNGRSNSGIQRGRVRAGRWLDGARAQDLPGETPDTLQLRTRKSVFPRGIGSNRTRSCDETGLAHARPPPQYRPAAIEAL